MDADVSGETDEASTSHGATIGDALILCGGEGSRLRAGGIETEKPLVEVCGTPMLDRVHDALAGSRIERIHAVVSPNAPATRNRAHDLPCNVIETPGEGYVADLGQALDAVDDPALTVAADLPLLTPDVVNRTLTVAEEIGGSGEQGTSTSVPSLTVCVPAALKRQLGVSADTTFTPGREGTEEAEPRIVPARYADIELAPTGVNVVGDSGDAIWVSHDARLTVNVNRSADLDVAESLCDSEGQCD